MLEVQLFSSYEANTLPNITLSQTDISVLITGETKPFRYLARHLAIPTELYFAVDLGCSTGETTHVLSKRYRRVVGVDISSEPISKARLSFPGVDFRIFDVLTDREALQALINEEPTSSSTVFFIDIGGDRLQDTVLILINHITETFHPPLIVVKSRKLFKFLSRNCLDADGIHCKIDLWQRLIQSTLDKQECDKKYFHSRRRLTFFVPGTQIPICQYHNYQVCKKGDECSFSHSYCHVCLQQGHRALECDVFHKD